MDKNYAQQLLKETRANYNRNASDFARARQNTWSGTQFLVEDYIQQGDKVLDLGCGNGRYFKLMKDKKIDYLGVDFSQELIDIASQNYSGNQRAEFKLDDILNLSLPDDAFDVIFSFAVFHHIPSEQLRQKMLREAYRVLTKEGKLILTVWNVRNDPNKKRKIIKNNLKKIVGLSPLDFNDIKVSFGGLDQIYLHCFGKKELINLVQETGFEVKDTGFIDWENKEKANLYVVAENG